MEKSIKKNTKKSYDIASTLVRVDFYWINIPFNKNPFR